MLPHATWFDFTTVTLVCFRPTNQLVEDLPEAEAAFSLSNSIACSLFTCCRNAFSVRAIQNKYPNTKAQPNPKA